VAPLRRYTLIGTEVARVSSTSSCAYYYKLNSVSVYNPIEMKFSGQARIIMYIIFTKNQGASINVSLDFSSASCMSVCRSARLSVWTKGYHRW